jgi:DnaJ like chaperone protein
MSIWARLLEQGARVFALGEAQTAFAGSGMASERQPSGLPVSIDPRTACAPDSNDIDFTAAVIGLGAKLAKADGLVTFDEVNVFRRVFRTAPEDAQAAQRVFDLARQSVHGYESYAKRIARRYRDRPCLLEGVLDGLFQIAVADGAVTGDELNYLQNVSQAFGFSPSRFERIKAQHLGGQTDDPYAVLGLEPEVSEEALRQAYRRLMTEHHPDRFASEGTPPEFQRIAHEKASSITSAYARIRAERGLLTAMH